MSETQPGNNIAPITDQHYGYNIIRTGFFVAAGLGSLYMALQFAGVQISDTIPAMVITGVLGFLAGRKT